MRIEFLLSHLGNLFVPCSGFVVVAIRLITVLVATEYLNVAGVAELRAVAVFAIVVAYIYSSHLRHS